MCRGRAGLQGRRFVRVDWIDIFGAPGSWRFRSRCLRCVQKNPFALTVARSLRCQACVSSCCWGVGACTSSDLDGNDTSLELQDMSSTLLKDDPSIFHTSCLRGYLLWTLGFERMVTIAKKSLASLFEQQVVKQLSRSFIGGARV